jgi:hypothetical protein
MAHEQLSQASSILPQSVPRAFVPPYAEVAMLTMIRMANLQGLNNRPSGKSLSLLIFAQHCPD